VSRVRRHRVRRLLLAASLLVPGLLLVAPSSQATSGTGAATVAGTGPFAGLKVSVSQTTNLIDQVVEVSWTGATPTTPSIGSFDRDYLQIMQCWGDDPSGPTREQCQFGGLVGDGRGGAYAASRQVSYGSTLVDPLETYTQPSGSLANVNVPFTAVSGKSESSTLNEFYDASSTNEIPFARTRADGTGREFFEVETAREAPGLGCGEPVTDPTSGARRGRSCWLVVVPRGDDEVNGKTAVGGDRLDSSPLSATNWAHRLVVPLQFQPIGISCPIGSAERRTVGQESVSEAISRWQPVLCQQSGRVYGFSSVGDDLARSQLTGPAPGMVFVSRPLDADRLPPAGPPVYAPVALSGLVLAYNLDSRAGSSAPDSVKLQNGERIDELNLSARLVAKLLTQSYQLAVNPSAPSVAGNPPDLLRDPDFLALNPRFQKLFMPGLASPLEPLGLADVYAELWAWVDSDPDAHAFLHGTPDPWGMKVNPNYKGLDLPRSDLPKSDPYCTDFGPSQAPLCDLDAHPYAADLHDAARATGRGDTLSRAVWDPTATPPSYKKGPPQLSGSRLVLAITDSASAERYRLPTARLLNAAGNLVGPTPEALLAGEKAMRPTTGGVLLSDPRSKAADAYPLTSLTYAATVPAALDAAARHDYGALLRYIGTAGQVPGIDPGQLPPGYAPLPDALRTQTLRAAAAVEKQSVVPPPATTTKAATSSGVSSVSPGDAAAPSARPLPAAARPALAGEALPPVTSSSRPAAGAVPPVVRPVAEAVPSRGLTPRVDVGSSRFLVGACLLLGALAALGGPLLTRFGAREGGGARA
jgi:hypothetical protein